MFKNPFSFNGRIRRTEYGLSILIYMVVIFTIQYILFGTNPESGTASIILLLLYIPILWFMLAQGAKRCHDRSNSGWYQIIPFYGIWMLFADSDTGMNEYGPNPKGIGNFDEIDQIGSELVP